MTASDPLENLVKALGRLPAIGRRSAERIALKLVQDHRGLVGDLVRALQEVEQSICCCSKCGSITPKAEDPCRLCRDPKRDDQLLCVVEEPGDILLIERAGGFRGRYHCLMGRISPMKGQGVDDLRVDALLRRVKAEGFKEVVLALNSDVEGDATASFLHDALAGSKARVSRIAFGMPVGSGIAYSDPVTLSRAIEGRQKMD